MVPVLGGFAITQFRRLSAYYGFTVSETPPGCTSGAGCSRGTRQTITLARVQGVVISEPVLWRRFGLGEARRRAGRLRHVVGLRRQAVRLHRDAGGAAAARDRAGPAAARRGRLARTRTTSR